MADNKAARMKGKRKEGLPIKPHVESNSSFFEEVMAFLILSIIFISLFWQGLLHEWQSIPVVIAIAVLSIIVILKSSWKDKAVLKEPFMAAVYFILIIASLLSLTQAAHIHDAVYALCKNSTLFLLVIAVKYLNNRMNLTHWLQKTMVIAGLIVAWFALDAVWSGQGIAAVNIALSGGTLQEGDRGFFFSMMTGDRPGSLFQYPNTTAAFLMTAWFMAIHRQLYPTPARKTHKAGAFFYAGTAFLIFLAFILTLSRGMYLIGVLSLFLYILLLPQEKKVEGMLVYSIGILPAMVIGLFSFSGGFLRNVPAGIAYSLFLVGFLLCGFLGLKIANIDTSIFAQKKKDVENAQAAADRKRRWLLAMGSVVLAGVLFAGIAWNWTRPFMLAEDGNLVRLFALKEAGEYTLDIDLAQDIDPDKDELLFSLSKQNRREMLQGSYVPLFAQDALNWQGEKTIRQPFVLEEKNIQLKLLIKGRQSGQAIESITIRDTEGKTVERIKLVRRILSDTLVQRIEAALNPKSAYDRFGFYFDAFEIFADHPLTGIGGKGWGYVYQRYQRYDYISNDVHSYGIQLAVEHGLGGLIALIGFAAALVIGIVKNAKTKGPEQLMVLTGAGVLFLHSMIDFDCFYYGIQLVMALYFSQIKISLPAMGKRNPFQKTYIFNTIVVLCALCACFFPFRFRQGLVYYSISSHISTSDRDQAVTFIEKATKCDPFTAKYKALLAQQILSNNSAAEGNLTKADRYAESAFKQGINDTETLRILVEYYMQRGEHERAYEVNGILVDNAPLKPDRWQERGELVDRILGKLDEDDLEERKYWLGTGLNIRQEMKAAEEGKWIEIKITGQLNLLFKAWQEETETS